MPGIEWNTVLPFATVLVAAASCCITYISVIISRKTYRSQIQPKIIVYVHDNEERLGMFIIRIHNIGHDVAEDITFSTDGPIPCPEEDRGNIEDSPLGNGIKSLAPGEKRDVLWGYYDELVEATNHIPVDIKYQYRYGNEILAGESCLEIKSFVGSPQGLKQFEKDVVKYLRGIDGAFKKTSIHLGLINKTLEDLSQRH